MTSLWRHLWPNYNTLDFKILTQCVKLLGERVLQVWWWYLHWFRRYRKKTRGGARNSPPSGARVKNGWVMTWNMLKSARFSHFPLIFLFLFLTDFDFSKQFLGSFLVFFLRKFDLKTCIAVPYPGLLFVWPFLPDDLRWPWPVLWSQSTGIHTCKCQWHYPCRLIDFVCA